MDKENESARKYYLKEFKRENKPAMIGENIQKVGAQIVEVMKKKTLRMTKHTQAFNMHTTLFGISRTF